MASENKPNAIASIPMLGAAVMNVLSVKRGLTNSAVTRNRLRELLADLCRGLHRMARTLVALTFLVAVSYSASLVPVMSNQKRELVMPTIYFLSQLPSDVPPLPEAASDVIVARVKVLERPVFLGGRDQSGFRPGVSPNEDLFASHLQILDVIRGQAAIGATLSVRFGSRHSRIAIPATPPQLAKSYFVVLYAGKGGIRHLAAFPMDEVQYQEWQRDSLKYEESRIPKKR